MRWNHLLLALAVILVWGFNYVVIEVGLQEMPPLFLCFARFYLTSIPAIFFVKFPATQAKWVFLYGLVMFAFQFAFLFLGMYDGVTPGLASLLIQSHVFFSVLFGVLFFSEPLKLWQVIGGLVSFSGIAIVGIHVGGNVTMRGLFLVIGAAIAWALGNLISKRIGHVNMSSLVIWGSFIAWPPLLAASLLIDGHEKIALSIEHFSWLSAGAVIYITYLSTFFAFGSWSFLIHRYGLSTIAPFTLLVPVIAIAGTVLLLNEPLENWKIFAGTLVLGGLAVNLIGPRIFSRK